MRKFLFIERYILLLVSVKPVAHDAWFPAGLLAGLEFRHIGCDAGTDSQYGGKILIQLAIQQENKHCVPQALFN